MISAMRMWEIGVGAFALLVIGVILFVWLSQTPATPINPNNINPGSSVPSQTTTVTLSPDAFSIAFYKWYLKGISGNVNFNTSSAFTSFATQWLTPEFASQFREIASSTESDPVLIAQDYPLSWFTTITAATITQTTSAEVLVSLGVGQELNKLHVVLTHLTNGWRIASVSKAP